MEWAKNCLIILICYSEVAEQDHVAEVLSTLLYHELV